MGLSTVAFAQLTPCRIIAQPVGMANLGTRTDQRRVSAHGLRGRTGVNNDFNYEFSCF